MSDIIHWFVKTGLDRKDGGCKIGGERGGVVVKLSKLPKRKVTVGDLLVRVDVDEALGEVMGRRERLKEVIIIGMREDDMMDIWVSKLRLDRIVFLLEVAKAEMLDETRVRRE